MTEVIPGLKLIRHNSSNVDVPDDPSFPFKLEVLLRPPEFMTLAFVGLYGGSEEVVVRSMTKEALDTFIVLNKLRKHPRLISLTVTSPEGIVEQL